jgi:hypothetical protein
VDNDGPDNPNEYDDEAYTTASNDLAHAITNGIDRLWAAGGTIGNIEAELNIGAENALIPGATLVITVTVR